MNLIYNLEFRIKNSSNKGKGFTLIELLIVMAIIGILSTFLLVNFVGIRQRARDTERKSNLRQVQSALELYRADLGSYPTSLPSCGSELTGGSPPTTYMRRIPCDPLNTGQHIFTYVSDGNTYNLYACLENATDSQKDATNNSTYCTGGTTNWSFTLQNP